MGTGAGSGEEGRQRIRLTIDRRRIAGPVSDIPVLVVVSAPELRGTAAGGGVRRPEQLRFVGADGLTRLGFEIEEYDPAQGSLRSWVRLPSLSPAADAVLHLTWAAAGADRGAPEPAWDEGYRAIFPPGGAGAPDDFIVPDAELETCSSLTVEAWIRCDEPAAEGLQVVAAQWSWRPRMDRFDAFDAGDTDGLATRGYFGAVFDGRYVHFAPQHDGERRHGKVLRYDTHGRFDAPASWAAHDAGSTSGLSTRGYYGAVFDGRYVYYVPRLDDQAHHTRILRYDSAQPFASPAGWAAFEVGLGISYQGAAFDGRHIYFAPGYHAAGGPSGVVLRYDTQGGFDDPASYVTYDASRTSGLECRCYDGAVFDGRWVYFAPLDGRGVVLRCDTLGSFDAAESWSARDCGAGGPGLGACVGAVYDGRYLYFVPYAHGTVGRYDALRDFHDPAAWSAFAAEGVSGLDTRGYDGAVLDGRYVYFVPFWEGEDLARGFHARVLRYDTRRDFDDRGAWEAVDAAALLPGTLGGYNGGAFDGRYAYFVPWRRGTTPDGGIVSHGQVLRYDTAGAEARFALKYVDCGHNGGLGAAAPGPSFVVNTPAGTVVAQAHRHPGVGWHYLVGVYDGERACLYLDGSLAGEQVGRGAPVPSRLAISVGGYAGEQAPFRGVLRQLRLSSRARSAAWVATAWENLRSPSEFARVVCEGED